MRVPLGDQVVYHGDGTATVTKRSGITGQTHSMTMKFTQEQYESWAINGKLIQNALPHLNSEEREFLMTGITPAEWEATFGSED